MAHNGVLAIVRRGDGAIALMALGAVPSADEAMPGLEYLYALTFSTHADAINARTGALVRLGKHVADGWVTGLSVGQVMSACKAEVDALGLDATSFRIRIGEESGGSWVGPIMTRPMSDLGIMFWAFATLFVFVILMLVIGMIAEW